MALSQYISQVKRAVFEDLQAGRAPSVGSFDAELLKKAQTKKGVQMGSTVYQPDHIKLEFIYPDPQGAAVVLSVRVESPERIVFMPVPDWVVQSIWQGEVNGSYLFESEAKAKLESFAASLDPEANSAIFGQTSAGIKG